MKAKPLLKRLYAGTVTALAVAQVLLVLVSWFLSATTAGHARSLLSSEGMRWFAGSFVSLLSTPWLVWLLLLSMAAGSLLQSGLPAAVGARRAARNYRQRVALCAALAFLVAYVAVLLLLTAVPHAVLLSSTGRLLPSPFSRALVPLVAFGLSSVSVVFGWVSGRFTSMSDVVGSWSYGIGRAAPLFVLYVVFVQFCASLRFVLPLPAG